MKSKTKGYLFILAAFTGLIAFSSCHKNNNVTPQLSSTPLYDTLGWFIQGATGRIAGNGIKMIDDPDNSGQKIQAGRLAIRTVVNKALGVIAGDPKLAEYFPTLLAEVNAGNTTGLAKLLGTFTDFVQQAASGQKVYKGLSMIAAHSHATNSRFGSDAHPTADSTDFNQFIGDIVQAAQSLNVPNSIIGQLGVALYSTEGDVVQDK